MKNLRQRIVAFVAGVLIGPAVVWAGLETGTYISDLVVTNPLSSDLASTADDHIRLLKSTIKTTFANVNGAVTSTDEELNLVDGIGTVWGSGNDGSGSGLDADTLDGVSSAGFLTTTTAGKIAAGSVAADGTLSNGLNMTSVTRNGAGDYTINYTAAGFSAIPACTFLARDALSFFYEKTDTAASATAMRILRSNNAGTAGDIIFRFSCHGN